MSIGKEVTREERTSSLIAILFSMDRALQLEAALHSFYHHCLDAEIFDLFVIYRTTSPIHTRQYGELIQEYRQFDRIHYFPEVHFRIDLLDLLIDANLPGRWPPFFKTMTRLGGMFGRVTRRWMKPAPSKHILFLVDDNIFIGDFHLSEAQRALYLHPDALGFSLRLGMNTNYCYSHDQVQETPHFELAAPGIIKFDWTIAEHDFSYPLEISSSIYRLSDVLPLINSRSFNNPNTLEGKMAASSSLYKDSHPRLLCYTRSVCFCDPINRVQDRINNRAGVQFDYPVDLLAEKFDAGYRIDVAALDGFVPIGCHQEVEFQFVQHAL